MQLGQRSRREFITLISGAAAWPITTSAQQLPGPVVGFLHAASFVSAAGQREAFRKGLSEAGYLEGKNVILEYRWAEGQYDRLPALATDLIQRPVAALVAGGGSLPALAAKATTTSIPVLFVTGEDPIKHGLVASINRPGANVTGVTFLSNDLGAKRLGLLRELVPSATSIAFLINPRNADNEGEIAKIQSAAAGLQIKVFRASSDGEVAPVFAQLANQTDAVLIGSDTFFATNQRNKLVALAAQHSMPAMFPIREFVGVGGLISYGTSIPDAYRQVGVYTGRVLKGEKPADLPVMQPTKFELLINVKTAKALGLKISDNLLSLADEVLE
jgi:ABC-type uncharacterized transport system substrate-binding protein